MAIQLPYSYQKRDIILVLPSTFFIDSFRQYGEEDSVTHLENLAKIMLITEIIARKRAFNPSGFKFGATSQKTFDIFKEKLGTIPPSSKLNLTAFKDSLYIDEEEGLNKLKHVEETVIAVADKLHKTYNLNPIIVVRGDSIKRWQNDYVKHFYRKNKSKKDTIAVLSVDNTLEYLKVKHRVDYYSARDSISDDQLKFYLPK